MSTRMTDIEARRTSVRDEELQRAIRSGADALWARQRADGSWDERSDLGPASSASVVVALHVAGHLTDGERASAGRWLRARQRPDGSFEPFPMAGKGSLTATAQCWAALSVTGGGRDDAAAAAERYVRRHGGGDAVVRAMGSGDTAAVGLALVGLLPPEKLPTPPLAWCLARPVVDALGRRVHFGIVMGMLELGLVGRHLRAGERRRGLRGRVDRAARDRALALLTTFQNANGSWNGNTAQTALALSGLACAGLGPEDPRVSRTAAWLRTREVPEDGGHWYDVFSSDVWTTAFNLRALAAAERSIDERHARAAGYILDQQLDVPQPAVDNRKRGAVRTGGWSFQRGNETMPDCDDTGVVLAALADVREDGELGRRIDGAVPLACAWLAGMQNPDGGWAAFVWNLPGHRPDRPLFAEPMELPLDRPLAALRRVASGPPELADASSEDITGRVLLGLGAHGARRGDPVVDAAIGFLRHHQHDHGGWWGRWMCNYLPCTAHVLAGLRRVGVPLSEAWTSRALDFLLRSQNDDGGWGESPRSYVDRSHAGRGESSAPLTGLVTAALLEMGAPSGGAVERGVSHLLRAQREDGTWANGEYLVPNIPPDTFYTYAGAARHLPLEALARYSAAKGG